VQPVQLDLRAQQALLVLLVLLVLQGLRAQLVLKELQVQLV
jgi:hypothetical protein